MIFGRGSGAHSGWNLGKGVSLAKWGVGLAKWEVGIVALFLYGLRNGPRAYGHEIHIPFAYSFCRYPTP